MRFFTLGGRELQWGYAGNGAGTKARTVSPPTAPVRYSPVLPPSTMGALSLNEM